MDLEILNRPPLTLAPLAPQPLQYPLRVGWLGCFRTRAIAPGPSHLRLRRWLAWVLVRRRKLPPSTALKLQPPTSTLCHPSSVLRSADSSWQVADGFGSKLHPIPNASTTDLHGPLPIFHFLSPIKSSSSSSTSTNHPEPTASQPPDSPP